MSSEHSAGTMIPADAWFVGSRSSGVYYPIGNPVWRALPSEDRVWFDTAAAAEAEGFRAWASGLEELDDFEILGELGRGGTAIVYRARERLLDREVAIKLIRESVEDDPETVTRFGNEIRLVATLRHPNIVSALSVRQLRGGGLALIMEYVPGRTLRQVLRAEGALPPERVERILRDIGGALAAAHRQRVVHRDVKPDNIFIEEATGRALLADFGIAVHLDSPSRLTRDGFAMGTPTYISPEQIDGRAVDGRSDLYSLALIGWEMLTGEKPWGDANIYSVIYKQKHESLPPLRKLRPDVPLRLSLAIEHALAKNPSARWATAEEFLVQLSEGSVSRQWFQATRALLSRRAETADRMEIPGTGPADQGPGAVPIEMETVVFRKEVFADLRPEAPPVGDLHTAHRLRLPGRWSLAAAAVGVLLTSVALASGLRESDAAPDPVQPLASGAAGAQPFLDRSDAPSPQAARLAEASDPPEHLPAVDLPESLGSTSSDPANSDIAELGGARGECSAAGATAGGRENGSATARSTPASGESLANRGRRNAHM
jgi:serine/threonine protein kinase